MMSDLVNRLRHIGTPETIVGEVEDLEADNVKLKDAIKGALRIKDLWRAPTYGEEHLMEVEHEGEYQALCFMENMFEELVKEKD
jgi:hypothetical protein